MRAWAAARAAGSGSSSHIEVSACKALTATFAWNSGRKLPYASSLATRSVMRSCSTVAPSHSPAAAATRVAPASIGFSVRRIRRASQACTATSASTSSRKAPTAMPPSSSDCVW